MRGFLVVALLLIPTVSCDSCEGRPVPFKIDGGTPPRAQEQEPSTPPLSVNFPRGRSSTSIGGAVLESPSRPILAVLTIDLGHQPGVLVVTRDENQGIHLESATREERRYSALTTVASLPADEGCQFSEISLRSLAPRLASASAIRQCNGGSERLQLLWVQDLQPPLRPPERFQILPLEGAAIDQLTMSPTSRDQDEDGFPDLLLELSYRYDDVTGSVPLLFHNRPGGWSRNPEEPRQTLEQLALEARQGVVDDLRVAAGKARRALSLYDTLCQRGRTRRLQFGSSLGVSDCGRAAARAAAVLVFRAIYRREFVEAVELVEQMQTLSPLPVDVQWIENAFTNAATREGFQLRRIGDHVVPATNSMSRLPAVALLSDGTVLLRGPAPRILDPETGHEAPSENATLEIRDPQNRWVARRIARTCNGYVVDIASVSGSLIASPLIEEAPSDPAIECHDLPETFTAQTGGWSALAWAPQGIVVARGREVRVVPVDADGHPAGPVVRLGHAPLPVPLPAGITNQNGDTRVYPSRYGVIVEHRGARPTQTLVQPEGWPARPVVNVAVAPSGYAFALLIGHEVWLLTQDD